MEYRSSLAGVDGRATVSGITGDDLSCSFRSASSTFGRFVCHSHNGNGQVTGDRQQERAWRECRFVSAAFATPMDYGVTKGETIKPTNPGDPIKARKRLLKQLESVGGPNEAT